MQREREEIPREGNLASEIAADGAVGILRTVPRRVVPCARAARSKVYRPMLGSPLLAVAAIIRRRDSRDRGREEIVVRFSWLSNSPCRRRRRRVDSSKTAAAASLLLRYDIFRKRTLLWPRGAEVLSEALRRRRLR